MTSLSVSVAAACALGHGLLSGHAGSPIRGMLVTSGAQMDDEGLTQALLRLLDDLDGCTLTVHDRVLDRIERALSAAGDVLGVDRVGLMLLDEHDELVAVGASDAAGRTLEHVQQRLGVGPGWDAMSTGQPVAVADLAASSSEHRDYTAVWRALQDTDLDDGNGSWIGASAASCVRAVLAVPVRSHGGMVGNLNAICEQAGPWTQRKIRAVQAYADVIGTLLTLSATALNAGDGAHESRSDGRWV